MRVEANALTLYFFTAKGDVKEMGNSTKKRSEMEKVQRTEDRLDNILFQCQEILRMPEKWAIDKQGNIITVYPHPIVKREAKRIEGIQYLPHNSYSLPDVLLGRLNYWESILDKTKPKAPKKKNPNRKPYVKVTDEIKETIVCMSNKGASTTEIVKAVGVSKTTVERYVKQYKELIKDWNNLREIAEAQGVTSANVVKDYVLRYKREA
jgi:hypothetical protein